MAFFDPTSTHMLSLIAAVYGVFVYTIAFSLEMFFIVTSPVTSSSSPSSVSLVSSSPSLEGQPAVRLDDNSDALHDRRGRNGLAEEGSESEAVSLFAFILAAVYFAVVMVSLLLILGIIIRSMVCVSAWLIAIVLLFFPEAALVFFITIHSWGVDSRNGQIELCFYVIRVILNIFFVICVQNLLNQWKTEKQASSFAFSLNAYNTYPTSNSPYIAGCSTTVNPVFKFASIGGSQFDTRTLNAASAVYDADADPIDYMQQHEKEMMQKQVDPDYGQTRRGMRRGSDDSHSDKFSTQSLDRRHLKVQSNRQACPTFKEEVILKPMSRRPFDYLHRPGSSADVTSEHDPSAFASPLSHSQSFNHRPHIFSSKTLPRHFERISSIQSLRDVAL